MIRENLEKIQTYLSKNEITAYRLLGNSFGFPLAVDIYQDNAVLQVFSQVETGVLEELQTALKNQLQIREFFYKNRTKGNVKFPSVGPKKIILTEYGHRFWINLSEYLDTGLFLDHRETRQWLAGLSHQKVILNTFAYAGSFSVYAAGGGATRTYSVDTSRVYCEWIKENLMLNNLALKNNWVIKMDALEFFEYAKKKQLVFDIIIIDPPTYSKNKGGSFSVQKDHPSLINAALGLLAPSGFILFSVNFKEFQMNQKDIKSCRIQEKRDTIPPDFGGSLPHRCFIISNQT